MSEVHVLLQGWEGKRNLISELNLFAEDGHHQVVHRTSLPPDATATSVNLADGGFHIYTLFTSMPYVYYTGADTVEVPSPSPVVLDLDKATIDDVLQPPP